MRTGVNDDASPQDGSLIDDIVRVGARRTLAVALEAEVDAYIAEMRPLLYRHGLSSGDFVPATEQFLGSSAGLSPATVTRLTAQWQDVHAAFQERDMSQTDYVNVWVDGIRDRPETAAA